MYKVSLKTATLVVAVLIGQVSAFGQTPRVSPDGKTLFDVPPTVLRAGRPSQAPMLPLPPPQAPPIPHDTPPPSPSRIYPPQAPALPKPIVPPPLAPTTKTYADAHAEAIAGRKALVVGVGVTVEAGNDWVVADVQSFDYHGWESFKGTKFSILFAFDGTGLKLVTNITGDIVPAYFISNQLRSFQQPARYLPSPASVSWGQPTQGWYQTRGWGQQGSGQVFSGGSC